MRSALASLLAVLLLSLPAARAAEAAVQAQDPIEIRPFGSAHFGMAGTVRVDGVTIEVLGEGDLAPPNRQKASFKFGPFTAEVIMIDDAVYTRTRFERPWSRQFRPEPTPVGPFSAADISRIAGGARIVGTEDIGGVPTDHIRAPLDFPTFVEPLLDTVEDPDARQALRTLEGTVELWVGQEDRMIRQERLVLALTLPPIEPEGDPVPASVDLTVAYSALNAPVSIEQPTRNDPSPLRTPRPNVTPLGGPVGAPPPPGTRAPAPAPAPAQVPRR